MSGKEKAAGRAPKAADKHTRTNILPLNTVTATCIECGTAFHRMRDENWKVRCVKCWVYLKHYRAVLALEAVT